MKTTNFNMDLMVPNQTNKDVIFNESLLTIDNFMCITLNGFLDNSPETLNSGEKYIIKNGEHKNHICYKTHESKGIDYFAPKKGTLFFVLENRSFMLYEDNNWQEVQFSKNDNEAQSSHIQEKFMGIDGKYEAPDNTPYLHLYLHKKTTLNLEKVNIHEVTNYD